MLYVLSRGLHSHCRVKHNSGLNNVIMSIKSFTVLQEKNKKCTTNNCWSQLREINAALDSIFAYRLSHKHSKEQAECDSEMIMLFVRGGTYLLRHGKSFILLHSMQKGTTATCQPKQCLGTAGNYGIWGKQRGCISQFIRKGKESVHAIIVTVRQATDSQPYKAQLQPPAEQRELRTGETFLLLLRKRQWPQ